MSGLRKASPGDVISSASSILSALKDILDQMDSISRAIAFGVVNHTPTDWEPLNVYYRSGTSDALLPETVPGNHALVYNARKTKGPTATGAVGVLAFKVKSDKPLTLAVLFSVPFDYNLYYNWWNVKIYEGVRRADYDMYYEMYNGDPFKGDNGWHERDLGHGLRVKGNMNSSEKATLQVHIRKVESSSAAGN